MEGRDWKNKVKGGLQICTIHCIFTYFSKQLHEINIIFPVLPMKKPVLSFEVQKVTGGAGIVNLTTGVHVPETVPKDGSDFGGLPRQSGSIRLLKI